MSQSLGQCLVQLVLVHPVVFGSARAMRGHRQQVNQELINALDLKAR
jgi:fido (protein-threonine AMPylation protein)